MTTSGSASTTLQVELSVVDEQGSSTCATSAPIPVWTIWVRNDSAVSFNATMIAILIFFKIPAPRITTST